MRSGWRPWHRAISLRFRAPTDYGDHQRLGSRQLDRTALRRRQSISALDPVERQYEQVCEQEPDILHGIPTSLDELAARFEADGARPVGLRRVFTASETLEPAMRRRIEEALGAPVYDCYAAAEAFIGWECTEHDRLHLNLTNVVTEILDDAGDPTPPGEIGRVVITTLDNPSMPLVRYAIGDVAIRGEKRRCGCGRAGPSLARVLGRRVPLLAVGAERVSPWPVVVGLHDLSFVRRIQLQQTAPDVLLTRVVVRPGHRLDAEAVRALISAELGPRLRVDLEQVAAIERLPSGKAPSSVGELTFPQPN